MSIRNIPARVNRGTTNVREYVNAKFNAFLAPPSTRGIAGFLFDVPRDEIVELTAEVTDHFTEDNSYINDHVINMPIEVTLSGFVGELVFAPPRGAEGVLNEIRSRLSPLVGFLGEYTPQALQQVNRLVSTAESRVGEINQYLDQAQNLVALFEGENAAENRQQAAYQQLFAFWASKQLLNVQTPWTYLSNMLITSITATQDEDTEQLTDISVRLKQLRFADPIAKVDYDETLLPVREAQQSEPEQDGGTSSGVEQEDGSALYRAFTNEGELKSFGDLLDGIF